MDLEPHRRSVHDEVMTSASCGRGEPLRRPSGPAPPERRARLVGGRGQATHRFRRRHGGRRRPDSALRRGGNTCRPDARPGGEVHAGALGLGRHDDCLHRDDRAGGRPRGARPRVARRLSPGAGHGPPRRPGAREEGDARALPLAEAGARASRASTCRSAGSLAAGPFRGVFGRDTRKLAGKALDAAERLDLERVLAQRPAARTSSG